MRTGFCESYIEPGCERQQNSIKSRDKFIYLFKISDRGTQGPLILSEMISSVEKRCIAPSEDVNSTNEVLKRWQEVLYLFCR